MAGASGSFLLVGAAAAAIWLLPPLFARISSRQLYNRTSLPLVRASLALLFLVMWLAEAMGSEPVLAAILAGFLLGRIIPRGSHRRATIEAIGYGFAVPFFFINVGVKFRSEEHTSELQSLMRISYAVFCLKKKNNIPHNLEDHINEY